MRSKKRIVRYQKLILILNRTMLIVSEVVGFLIGLLLPEDIRQNIFIVLGLISLSTFTIVFLSNYIRNLLVLKIQSLTESTVVSNKAHLMVPSYEFERKTRALSFHLMALSIFLVILTLPLIESIKTVVMHLSDNISESIKIIEGSLLKSDLFIYFVGAILVLSIWMIKDLKDKLLISYKVEDDKIVEASLNTKVYEMKRKSYAEVYSILPVENKDEEYKKLLTKEAYSIVSIMKINSKRGFVNSYFDTNLYSKYAYSDVEFKEATKRHLIYYSQGEKLKIPNIYKNEHSSEFFKKEKSITKRILSYYFIILILLTTIYGVTATIKLKQVNKVSNNIQTSQHYILK